MAEHFQSILDKANVEFTENLEQKVRDVLREKKVTVAVAESMTGGLVSALFTRYSGSSENFLGGAVCYSSRAKVIQTGIEPKIIAENGVVSGPTAEGLAKGIREKLFADIGLSVTGVAGPQSHGGKPVGTVFIALSDKDREIVKQYFFEGSRDDIRQKAAQAVLGHLWIYLKEIS